jgi:hypothetical protein
VSTLTRHEKTLTLNKITRIVQKKILDLKNRENWDYQDISKKTGVPQNRMSELVSKGAMSEKTLALLLGGGIVSVNDLLQGDFGEEERAYIETLSIYEDALLRGEAAALKKMGLNPGKILREAREKCLQKNS